MGWQYLQGFNATQLRRLVRSIRGDAKFSEFITSHSGDTGTFYTIHALAQALRLLDVRVNDLEWARVSEALVRKCMEHRVKIEQQPVKSELSPRPSRACGLF